MTPKEYNAKHYKGIVLGGKWVAPFLSRSETAIQYIVADDVAQAVIDHLAAAGLSNVRSMSRNGKTAIEAK